jgi:uncharacterized protein (DUF1778 family)
MFDPFIRRLLVAFFLLMLLLIALVSRRRRKYPTLRTAITVEVDMAKYRLYRRYAEISGMSLENFVLQLLQRAIPKNAEQQLDTAVGAHVDAAFQELDAVEARELQWTTQTAPPLVLLGVKGHPCLHLQEAIPRYLRPGECQGSCGEETQLSKPCQWPAHVAHNCPVYEPTVRKKS